MEEKLSLEKDNEAAQTSNKKSVTAAFLAAEEILQNPKMRLILAIVGGALLFLFILVVCIVVNYTGDVWISFDYQFVSNIFAFRMMIKLTASYESFQNLEDLTI